MSDQKPRVLSEQLLDNGDWEVRAEINGCEITTRHHFEQDIILCECGHFSASHGAGEPLQPGLTATGTGACGILTHLGGPIDIALNWRDCPCERLAPVDLDSAIDHSWPNQGSARQAADRRRLLSLRQ